MSLLISSMLLGCTVLGDCPEGTELRDDGACHRLASDPEGGGGDSGATGDGGQVPGATWTAADVAVALDAVLSAGAVHGLPVFTAYESYLEHREGTCPSMEDPESEGPYGVWQTDHCETGAGYVFEGFGMYLVNCTDPADNDMEPGVGVDSRGLVSQYRLKAPDGAEMQAGGDCSHECRFDADGGISCFDQIGGSYRADGREPWLDGGVEASLFMTHQVGVDGRRTTIDGGIGLPAADISFREVEVDWEECDGLATGTVAIRDPSGWWFSLVLSGDCSGCGELWLGDLDLGQLCVDIAGTLRDAVAGWEQPCWL